MWVTGAFGAGGFDMNSILQLLQGGSGGNPTNLLSLGQAPQEVAYLMEAIGSIGSLFSSGLKDIGSSTMPLWQKIAG